MLQGNVRRKKKSGLSIKIKPFSNPPSVPNDFYATTSSVLFSSLESILQDVAHVKSSLFRNGVIANTKSLDSNVKDDTPFIDNVSVPPLSSSREELYGKVQDLCSHGYGPQLYRDILLVLNRASFACVKRLVSVSQGGGGRAGGGGAGLFLGFDSRLLCGRCTWFDLFSVLGDEHRGCG
jgi:hypothetical protein